VKLFFSLLPLLILAGCYNVIESVGTRKETSADLISLKVTIDPPPRFVLREKTGTGMSTTLPTSPHEEGMRRAIQKCVREAEVTLHEHFLDVQDTELRHIEKRDPSAHYKILKAERSRNLSSLYKLAEESRIIEVYVEVTDRAYAQFRNDVAQYRETCEAQAKRVWRPAFVNVSQ
jgi:hypothetical protein